MSTRIKQVLPPGGVHQSGGPQDFVIFNQSQDSSKSDQIRTVLDWLKDDPWIGGDLLVGKQLQ